MANELKFALKSLDCIVFKYQQRGLFEAIFVDTDWYANLFSISSTTRYFSLYGHSLFVDDFIRNAEEFWQEKTSGVIDSGIWTEQLVQNNAETLMHFEAEAIYSEGNSFLIIKNLAKQFSERQKMLQSARDLILSNEDLVAKHNYTQERIEAMLMDSTDAQFVVDTISHVVDAVNTGVIITDEKLSLVMENPAVQQLFSWQNQQKNEFSLRLLLNLLNKQYPEFDRIISSMQPWQGEVCWVQPPFNMKWFMLSLIPRKDENHQLKQWVFLISDISRVKYLQQQNEKLTLIDHLTDLPNRQYYWNSVDGLVNQSTPFYTLYIDIKNFKAINEEFGHKIGDEVLVIIAEQIQQVIKRGDIVARIGGDEFAVVLQNITERKDCQKVIDRINRLILIPYLHRKINNLNITLNIGAACYPDDGDTVERLMKCADIAVNQAKSHRDCHYVFYSTDIETEALKQMQLKKEMARALESNQFELYFQPIYEMTNQQVAKIEVLLRWNHPELGLVMPSYFIPLAEETGLIVPLGKWVFNQACKTLEKLKFRGHNICIAVNLSPRQFNDITLAEFIEKTINQYNITAKCIELEVTEGLLISNFESVLIQLGALRKVGINISVDDFGTGYSSLSYLKKLPIDTLKIDRSFVMDLASDNNDKAIVSAVIAMAHKLNLSVVAEGVEQHNQLVYLIDNHCDYIQGYLFSKPVPFEQLCHVLDLKAYSS